MLFFVSSSEKVWHAFPHLYKNSTHFHASIDFCCSMCVCAWVCLVYGSVHGAGCVCVCVCVCVCMYLNLDVCVVVAQAALGVPFSLNMGEFPYQDYTGQALGPWCSGD